MTAQSNDQPFLDRSEEAAHRAIKRATDAVFAHVDDDLARAVVDEALIDEVFRVAWQYQFSEARAAARSELQQVVGDRVAEVLLAVEEEG